MDFKTFRLNREELYEQVWSQPMTKLAQTYGLSDNGLRKICKKHNIPLPSIGYWAKKQYGKKVKILPLPPEDKQNDVEIEIKINEEIELPIDEIQCAEAQKLIEFEKDPKNRISVPHKLLSQHSLISHTKATLQNSKVDQRGYLYPKGKHWLDIKVAPKSLNRARRIMNQLIKSLEDRGFNVLITSKQKHSYYTYYITTVSVLKQTIEFRLREKFKRVQEKWEYSDNLHYKYVPSGPLLLEIMSYGMAQKEWMDRPAKRLENRLNEFTIGLIKYAVKERSSELEREQWEREWQEEKRIREENERLINDEEAKVSALYTNAENWTKSQHLRKYITTVKNNALKKNEKIGNALEQWIIWANQQADRLDPLKESPHSILDEGDTKSFIY